MPAQRLVASKKIPARRIERLDDNPKFQAPDGAKGWEGYFHYMDQTILPFRVLTYPSANCSIPNYDKIVPDLGKTLLGQAYTENIGINGNKQKFTSLSGLECEVRSYPSTDTNKKDIIEVYFENDRLLFGTLVGTFQLGETVTGGTSSANGTITNILNTVLTLDTITGNFAVGETITGSNSGATAVVISAPISIFHQITENINPIPRGVHEYYFDEWFDTKETSTVPNSVPGINCQRLIWVNGYQDPSTKKGAIYSWTGGIALITAVTANTIVIDASTSWKSLGFNPDASGNAYVMVNGVSYTVPVAADFNTSTINVASTAGISVGDYAFSKIEESDAPLNTPFDVCRAYHGYMYYGNWNQKSLYQSNEFNRDYDYEISAFQALDNDLVLNLASAYTGTTQSVYHIVIDSIQPDLETQIFSGTGNNNIKYDTSAYNGNPGVKNIYSMVFVADFTMRVHPTSGTFKLGEMIVGTTSKAIGKIVGNYVVAGDDVFGIAMQSGAFVSGETITGQSTLATGTSNNTGNLMTSQNWVEFYKNGIVQSITIGTFSGTINPIGVPPFSTPFTPILVNLGDGLTITFSNPYSNNVGDYFELDIEQGGADTFSWSKDGGAITANVPITGGIQFLSDGVSFSFGVKNGHAIGDFWNITAFPTVTRAFANFYYAIGRLPGEGYIYRLPTNFWTMDTQEEELYVNGSYGDWTMIKTTTTAASVDTASETLDVIPLKQTGANKVLFPYLTGHMNNELVYVTKSHTLDMLSRLIAVEKPQVSYLSDPVKLDFEQSSFIGGRIKYHNKRLYISSPKEGVTHCFDFFRSYWQPPKLFPEVGLLSIVGEDLVCHSNLRNQSFTMFTSASGDNGGDYSVEMRTPYTSHGMRWKSKYSNMSFIEGYISGAPQLIHTVYIEPNGCGGIFSHVVNPVICVAPSTAPFGAGSFGSHPFGNDNTLEKDYFKELNKAYSPVMQWYFMSLGISCSAKSHTYNILSLGMNEMMSQTGNQQFINKDNLPTS